ncbi:MAG TPA: methyltransferase domain-containing protein [Methanolinea sp.]|jgi:tRNA (adenine57-N1/adenine58-N1)-methyltransferase|nr:MAG: tRNA (adenine(57)-N(1)/adenine(58)-N(1))-methyltransferase TrmI [Methanoregulaceae archaeon PtaB.Bin009]HII75976.1 methyltransferase domain-containing protein [Methanolinea sp.]HNQ29877.1 methyltransferase domain-containing protein [Methanolinea sp.]HNS83367.1 methyltransferase domain-containing protein [Methanolinea sp.]
MFEAGERVLLVGGERTFFVRAGTGSFSTDRGVLDLDALLQVSQGDVITTHTGQEFRALSPRPTDFFSRASRSGAPMLPKDIGLVIAYTGMNNRDTVLDAGTGSGIAAIYFGGIAKAVRTCEIRPEFSRLAEKNIQDAKLPNVDVVCGDVLSEEGLYDVVHFDLTLTPDHVHHAHSLLRPGGYLACYTPFIEHLFTVMDAAGELFTEIQAHECIEREMTRSQRGSRPSTRVCHSGYVTVARK